MTQEETAVAAREARFSKWVGRIVLVILLLWLVQLIAFITYNMLTHSPPSDGWLNKLAQEHYPAMIGIPLMAIGAFCIVVSLKVAIGSPIEFKALGFEFRGASGPVVMWIMCFLALILALYLLWNV